MLGEIDDEQGRDRISRLREESRGEVDGSGKVERRI
jgi:hypothetical protein